MTIVIAITLMSFSCCKDEDPIVDEGLITLEELDGVWNFVSYEFLGTEYNCTSVMPENMGDVFSSLTFDVENKTVLMDWVCTAGSDINFDFTKDKNIINFNPFGYVDNEIYYTFTVLSYDGNLLKLRLDLTPSSYIYHGGTMILEK